MADRNHSKSGEVIIGGYVLKEQVGHLLRRAHQRHVSIFQEKLAVSGLTPTQFAALIKICGRGHVSQNLLGRLAAMDPATTQGVIRRLIARGLVQRGRDPMDRRTTVLSPTPAGLDVATRAVPCALAVTEATLALLDPQERATFLALLRKLG
jgi:DNA-binding MarR family transcriptional regulator